MYNILLMCVTCVIGMERTQHADNESTEVWDIIKPGRWVKLNRSQVVNFHKLLTIRYLHTAPSTSFKAIDSRLWIVLLFCYRLHWLVIIVSRYIWSVGHNNAITQINWMNCLVARANSNSDNYACMVLF